MFKRMNLHIEEVTTREAWDRFLRDFAPHSFLHSWDWAEFQVRTGTSIVRLGVFDGSRMVAAALVLHIQARRGSFLFCPHGPIIATEHDEQQILVLLLDELKRRARQRKCVCIRISPLMQKNASHALLWKELGFRDAPTHMHPELAWILDITPDHATLLQGMRKTTRYSIKKAEKDGVIVRQSADINDLEVFWRVYETTVRRQQFTPFSKEYLRSEFETFAQDDAVRLFIGLYQNEPISAAMIVYDEISGYYHHGASDQRFAKIPASSLVQWHAIQEAKRRGCRLYNFWGVVPESETNHPWAGLSLFKRGFGGFEEAYVHAQDLVISPRYWLTYIIETVRRLKRGL